MNKRIFYISAYRPGQVVHIFREDSADIVTLCNIPIEIGWKLHVISGLEIACGKFMCDECRKAIEGMNSDV